MKLFLTGLFTALFMFSAPIYSFDESHVQGIEVIQPWAPNTGKRTMSAAVYFKIKNHSSEDDKLISVASDLAERVMLHRSLEEDGIMRMRHMEELTIPAGGEAALEPGNYHIMMMQLAQPLKRGETFPLTLEFEKAGKMNILVEITGIGGPEG